MASNDYAPTIIDGVQCVWLQGIGWHKAKPLGDIVIGDSVVYNYGSRSEVVDVEKSKSGTSVILTVESKGARYTGRSRRASTLVAVR